jgi:hypothetical protein
LCIPQANTAVLKEPLRLQITADEEKVGQEVYFETKGLKRFDEGREEEMEEKEKARGAS